MTTLTTKLVGLLSESFNQRLLKDTRPKVFVYNPNCANTRIDIYYGKEPVIEVKTLSIDENDSVFFDG
jgi:hypothetical protein